MKFPGVRNIKVLSLTLLSCSITPLTAIADDEMSNFAHATASPYGRCYGKSIPKHIYDLDNARQAGTTQIYRVHEPEDQLIGTYDWFAQKFFVLCRGTADALLIRIGPWQRGHNPNADHLALSFYANGKLLKSYSTLDIAGDILAKRPSFSKYKNVSASVSHYTVFKQQPQLKKRQHQDGVVFTEEWVVQAITVDGRTLIFDPKTGKLR